GQALGESHAIASGDGSAPAGIHHGVMPVVVVGLGIGLAQHADADLDEGAGLGCEAQRSEFLHWATGGAVGPTYHPALRVIGIGCAGWAVTGEVSSNQISAE